MQAKFTIPATKNIKVHYRKDGVTYQAVIARPLNHDNLLMEMLKRKVGFSNIVRVLPAS